MTHASIKEILSFLPWVQLAKLCKEGGNFGIRHPGHSGKTCYNMFHTSYCHHVAIRYASILSGQLMHTQSLATSITGCMCYLVIPCFSILHNIVYCVCIIGYVFCFLHRLPEQHSCIYDHKEVGRLHAMKAMVPASKKKIGRSFHRMDSRPE